MKSPSQVQTWPESATIVVACLCGVLAACMALLVLLEEGAPNPPRSVKVETVVVREVDGTSLPAWRSSLRLTENVEEFIKDGSSVGTTWFLHPSNQLNV